MKDPRRRDAFIGSLPGITAIESPRVASVEGIGSLKIDDGKRDRLANGIDAAIPRPLEFNQKDEQNLKTPVVDALACQSLLSQGILSVLLVAMPPMMQFSIVQVLTSVREIEVLRTVPNISLAPDIVAEQRPDVIVLFAKDVLPKALDAVTNLRVAEPSAKILLLTETDNEWSVISALQAGVSGYAVSGSVWPEDIRAGVQAIARGELWVCPAITKRLVSSLIERASQPTAYAKSSLGLSEREMEILRLVADGAKNSDIAEKLVLSPNTVKTYLRRIMDKFEVDSRQNAVAKAIRKGVIPERRERCRPEGSLQFQPVSVTLSSSPEFTRKPNGAAAREH